MGWARDHDINGHLPQSVCIMAEALGFDKVTQGGGRQ